MTNQFNNTTMESTNKYIFLFILLLLSPFLLSQSNWQNQMVNIDTLVCHTSTDSLRKYSCIYKNMQTGFNQIFDTTGQLIEEGIVSKKRQLLNLFNRDNSKKFIKVGLWMYYNRNRSIRRIENFDKKGNILSVIYFWDNEVIKEKKFKWEKEETYTFYYLHDGKPVKSQSDYSKYIDLHLMSDQPPTKPKQHLETK